MLNRKNKVVHNIQSHGKGLQEQIIPQVQLHLETIRFSREPTSLPIELCLKVDMSSTRMRFFSFIGMQLSQAQRKSSVIGEHPLQKMGAMKTYLVLFWALKAHDFRPICCEHSRHPNSTSAATSMMTWMPHWTPARHGICIYSRFGCISSVWTTWSPK